MRASRTFVLALRRPRLKNLSSDLVRRQIPSYAVPKACLKSRAKKIPKSVGARTHPCLTPLWMSKGLEEQLLNCTVPFMFVWKDSIMLCNFGEIQVAEQTVYLNQSHYTDTGPTIPSADLILPGAWQGSHWSAHFEVTGMTRPGKIGNRTPDVVFSRRTPQPLDQRGDGGKASALRATEQWSNPL